MHMDLSSKIPTKYDRQMLIFKCKDSIFSANLQIPDGRTRGDEIDCIYGKPDSKVGYDVYHQFISYLYEKQDIIGVRPRKSILSELKILGFLMKRKRTNQEMLSSD